LVKELSHMTKMSDGNPYLANFAGCMRVVGVVARLRGQIKRDGKASLTLREVHSIESV
jgi:hypothetical protein